MPAGLGACLQFVQAIQALFQIFGHAFIVRIMTVYEGAPLGSQSLAGMGGMRYISYRRPAVLSYTHIAQERVYFIGEDDTIVEAFHLPTVSVLIGTTKHHLHYSAAGVVGKAAGPTVNLPEGLPPPIIRTLLSSAFTSLAFGASVSTTRAKTIPFVSAGNAVMGLGRLVAVSQPLSREPPSLL